MYKKVKYILLILFLIGSMIFCYDYFKNFNGIHFLGITELQIKFSLFLALIILVYLSFSNAYKKRNDTLSLGIVIITIIYFTLNLNRGISHYNDYRYDKIMTEYENTNCAKMKEKFISDLSGNNLKLFIGGGHYNAQVEKRYNLEVFSNGSYDNFIGVGENRNCYNELVEEYYLKEFNINIRSKLYENITVENIN